MRYHDPYACFSSIITIDSVNASAQRWLPWRRSTAPEGKTLYCYEITQGENKYDVIHASVWTSSVPEKLVDKIGSLTQWQTKAKQNSSYAMPNLHPNSHLILAFYLVYTLAQQV